MKLKNILFVVFLCMVSGCLSASINKSFVELKNCNIYEGKWVYDESFPLFDSSKCSAIRGQFNCLKYGRPDHQYLKYRWQPNACNLPKYAFHFFRDLYLIIWLCITMIYLFIYLFLIDSTPEISWQE